MTMTVLYTNAIKQFFSYFHKIYASSNKIVTKTNTLLHRDIALAREKYSNMNMMFNFISFDLYLVTI